MLLKIISEILREEGIDDSAEFSEASSFSIPHILLWF
jgi:hypothetical protein